MGVLGDLNHHLSALRAELFKKMSNNETAEGQNNKGSNMTEQHPAPVAAAPEATAVEKEKRTNPGWSAVVIKVGPDAATPSAPELIHAASKNDLRPMLKDASIAHVLWIFRGKEVNFKETRQISF